jgi:hypothetical protein
MTVTVSGFMRPLLNNGPASVSFLVVVDEEGLLEQMVLTKGAALETGRIVQHGRLTTPR